MEQIICKYGWSLGIRHNRTSKSKPEKKKKIESKEG